MSDPPVKDKLFVPSLEEEISSLSQYQAKLRYVCGLSEDEDSLKLNESFHSWLLRDLGTTAFSFLSIENDGTLSTNDKWEYEIPIES